MYTEKFLQQVQRKINERGITNSKLRDTCIDIYEGETEIFKIDGKGSMFYSSDKQFRNVVDELHEIIQPIVCEVDEYLRAMENGTELKAKDFDMPYIKLQNTMRWFLLEQNIVTAVLNLRYGTTKTIPCIHYRLSVAREVAN